jgi:hypothetical protein
MVRLTEVHFLAMSAEHILLSSIVGFRESTEANLLNMNMPENEVKGEYTLENQKYSFTMKVDAKGSLISYTQQVFQPV